MNRIAGIAVGGALALAAVVGLALAFGEDPKPSVSPEDLDPEAAALVAHIASLRDGEGASLPEKCKTAGHLEECRMPSLGYRIFSERIKLAVESHLLDLCRRKGVVTKHFNVEFDPDVRFAMNLAQEKPFWRKVGRLPEEFEGQTYDDMYQAFRALSEEWAKTLSANSDCSIAIRDPGE